MICYNCGHTLNLKADLNCPICGMKFPLRCTKCNEFNPLYSKYCSNCGAKMDTNMDSINNGKSFDILNENRRKVAVIFADISGFTALSEKMDPEEIRELVNGCFEYITKPVYELEGTIDKFIGDCVMILFGAKYSHSDDAVRAVKCAIRMMELVKEYSRQRLYDKSFELNLSIGINYGLVVTGKVGNLFDIDYTVMGDTVNTAQRLQSYAGKGNILVSDSCYEYTNDCIVYSKPNEIMVKNKEKAVKCYNVIKIVKNKKTYTDDLFERKNEIKYITNSYFDIHNKRFINIIGESGIGKTSLIKSFLLQELVEDVNQIWVSCSSMYKIKSYYVINNILSQLAGIVIDDDMYVLKQKLKTFLNYVFKDTEEEIIIKVYNILSIIMGFEISEDFNKILKSMEYNDLLREIDSQLKFLFRKLYDLQNYILVIDDLQWADEISIRILNKLARDLENSKSLYIFISQTKIEELSDEQNTIQLGYLSREGIESLVIREFKCNTVNGLLLDKLIQLTNGNPLYTMEYIAALKRNRQFYVEDEKLFIYKDYIEQVPDSIENVILSNLSGLGNTAINILHVASCIGKEFNINWVKKVLKDNADEEEVLSELKQFNIISLKNVYTSEGILNKVYVFNHDTVRNVIYNSILNKYKIEYLENIGLLIEKDYYNDLERYYTDLYTYFLAAKNLNKARDYAYKAANKYKRDFNYYDALEYFNIFINSLEERSDNTRIMLSYKEMGYINFILGDGDKAVEYLNTALCFTSLSEEIYSIKLMLVEVFNDRANYDEALSLIEQIEHKIRENSNVYGKMLLLKCLVFYFKRNKDMLVTAETSERILLETKDNENLAQTENIIGLYYFSQGDISNALYYFNKAYKLCEEINNIKLISSISNNLGMLYHMSGRISKSFEYFNKALEASKSISNLRAIITSSINLGILYLEKGGFHKSEDLLMKALEKAKQVTHIYLQCTALMNIGEIAYKRGSFQEAHQYFNEALDLSVKHEMKAEEGINYINISKVLMKQNKYGKAEAHLKKAFIILKDINETSGLIDYYICKCKIEIKNSNFQNAQKLCELVNGYLEESEDDFKKIIVLQLWGSICLNTGQYERALEFYNSSINLGEQLETEYQIAKGYYYRANLYKAMKNDIQSKKDIHDAIEYISKVDSCELKKLIENSQV